MPLSPQTLKPDRERTKGRPKGKTDRGERQEEGEKRDTTRKETGRETDDKDSNTKTKNDTESREEKNRDPDTTDDKTVCEASSYTTGSKKKEKEENLKNMSCQKRVYLMPDSDSEIPAGRYKQLKCLKRTQNSQHSAERHGSAR